MKWFGLCAMALAGTATAGERCDAVKLERHPVCMDAAGGLVLAPDAEQARDVLAVVEAGRPIFENLFGRAAPAYAVIFDNPTGEEIATLNAAGYEAVLPWIDAGALVAAFEAKLREAIRSKVPNISKEQEDQAVAAQLEQLKANIGGPSAAAHEMGHLWFTHVFWPSIMRAEGPITHYGSPAPDWLDEISGLAFEDAAMADNRRLRFRELWTKGEGIVPLPQFLAMTHPELEKSRAQAQLEPPAGGAGGGEGGGRVMVRVEATERSLATSAFYAQGRVFADFLIAHGKPGLLGAIAAFVSRGGDFEAWLAAEGAAYGLPADLTTLDATWMTWASDAYGVPG